MDCVCHGSPMLWSRDTRYRAGGFWHCGVKARERFARWYANPENADSCNRQRRERYDADPVHRISKRLHDDATRRAATLKRRRDRLGPLPH